MKNHKYWILKDHRIYTVKEVSKLLKVHVCTVRSWIKQGLKIVPNSISPILIRGKDLKSFLKKRAKARKCKLVDNQFYCLKCRQACHSELENIKVDILESLLSEDNHKAVIHGICKVCGSELHLFSSERIVQNWLDQGWVYKENVVRRYNSNKSSGKPYSQNIKTFGLKGGYYV